MLSLRQKVRGDELRPDRVVGDDQDFGRARRQITRGAIRITGHGLLRSGDPDIARAENLIDLGDRGRPIGQRRDRLCAPDLEDFA